MTQTISLTPSTVPLGLNPVWRATPFALTGAVGDSELTTWRAQLWRRPQDCRDEDAEPLATVYGAVSGENLTIAFPAALMDFELRAGEGSYDDVWLVVGGFNSSATPHVVVADWVRVKEGGFRADDAPTTTVEYTIEDDVIIIPQDGSTYRVQGVPIETPEGIGRGTLVVIDDIVYFTPLDGTTSWQVQGVPVATPEAAEGEQLKAIDGLVHVTPDDDGTSWQIQGAEEVTET